MCEMSLDEIIKENKSLMNRIDELEKQLEIFDFKKEGNLENWEFNRALFEYNPIQTIVVDTQGRVIGYNQAKRCSGDSLPDIGDVMYRDYAGNHEADMYSELMDSIKTGSLKEFHEQRYRKKYLSIKISPFIGGAVITSQDITKRKNAEDALRNAEREKAAILDSMSSLVTYQDTNHRILWVNRNAGDYFGLRPDEAAGRFCYELWYNRTAPCENCPASSACKTGEPYEKESVSADGRIGITRGHPVRGEEGKIVGVVEVTYDITERKKMEEMLDFERKQFLSIFDGIDEMVYVSDTETYEIIYVNTAMKEVFKRDVRGEKCYKVFQGKDSPCEFCTNDIILNNGGESYKWEHYNSFVGKHLWIIDRIIKWPDGRDVRFEFTVDVTKRNQLEEQLQIRQRMDSIGTLAGGIAHDFNNILAGIVGYVDMLIMSSNGFTSEQKEYLYSVSRGCDRAADLTDKFHTLSGGARSKKESVDIYDVANEVFGVLKETTDRLIEKKIDIKRGEYYVKTNASEFNQVLLNLGMNSVQAIESRGVKPGDYFRIKAENYVSEGLEDIGLAAGEYVHIQFEDSGRGMSKEVQKKAFDPLFTTRAKGSQKGQGLGLAMVYNIVTRFHKGGIEIESKEGSGTIFHIYLPKAGPERTKEEYKDIDFHKRGGTILVVDDEEVILNMVKSIYKKYKYKVLTALDGEEALEIYKKKKKSIDLVVLDLIMPKMSGRMLFEKMLAINPDLKAIITSGHSKGYSRKGILSKAKGYLKKPFKLDELLSTTKAVLDMEG